MPYDQPDIFNFQPSIFDPEEKLQPAPSIDQTGQEEDSTQTAHDLENYKSYCEEATATGADFATFSEWRTSTGRSQPQ